mmetsp:Transcript_30531/g.47031  ORF Transcript_30531/g.47031 Transcript_30531/m.47031 type:complete len:255 (-) Transcript_30531:94-858(-)
MKEKNSFFTIDVLNQNFLTPLSIAVSQKYLNEELVHILLANGTDPFGKNDEEFSPLFNEHYKIVRILIFLDKIKEPISQKCAAHLDSISHLSIIKGEIDIIDMIFKKGANINFQNESGDSCLHLAVELRNTDIELLISTYKADQTIVNKNSKSVVEFILAKKLSNLFQLAIQNKIDLRSLQVRSEKIKQYYKMKYRVTCGNVKLSVLKMIFRKYLKFPIFSLCAFGLIVWQNITISFQMEKLQEISLAIENFVL